LEPTLHWTGKQELDQALIAPSLFSSQKVHTLVDTVDLKLLAWLNRISLPNCGGQENLSLLGNDGLHNGKFTCFLWFSASSLSL
jgi:hypothetical protein